MPKCELRTSRSRLAQWQLSCRDLPRSLLRIPGLSIYKDIPLHNGEEQLYVSIVRRKGNCGKALTVIILHVNVRLCISAGNNPLYSLEAFNLFTFPLAIDFESFDIFARELSAVTNISLFKCVYRFDIVLDSLDSLEASKCLQVLPCVCEKKRSQSRLS